MMDKRELNWVESQIICKLNRTLMIVRDLTEELNTELKEIMTLIENKVIPQGETNNT